MGVDKNIVIIHENNWNNRYWIRVMLYLLNYILCVLDEFELHYQIDVDIGTLHIDFSRAFDTVEHSALIIIFAKLVVANPVLRWIQSYLGDGYQFVDLLNNKSNDVKATSVVTTVLVVFTRHHYCY